LHLEFDLVYLEGVKKAGKILGVNVLNPIRMLEEGFFGFFSKLARLRLRLASSGSFLGLLPLGMLRLPFVPLFHHKGLAKSALVPFRSWFDTSPRTEDEIVTVHPIGSP
jgi:hypothetical protein